MTTTIEAKKIPNKKQQECIDNLKGKYLVLVGPGRGKTFTIIERIKNLLSKGVEPEQILCLTYTDAACNEMKNVYVIIYILYDKIYFLSRSFTISKNSKTSYPTNV